MTATGHAVIGTVIASQIGDPAFAIPLAILSHIAADLFPHWDPGTNRTKKSHERFFKDGFLDVLSSLALTFILIVFVFPDTNLIYAYIIVFAAQFLDWASAPFVFFHITNPPVFQWVYKFQKTFDNRMDKPWGIIGQVVVLVGIVLFFKFY
ncbi:MAG: hypothetical protein HY426_03380 [Candidatus Levybacteria bacterium]|nr:hypothetical protein [Candidatus Levybacteria bacterium]